MKNRQHLRNERSLPRLQRSGDALQAGSLRNITGGITDTLGHITESLRHAPDETTDRLDRIKGNVAKRVVDSLRGPLLDRDHVAGPLLDRDSPDRSPGRLGGRLVGQRDPSADLSFRGGLRCCAAFICWRMLLAIRR